MKFEFIDLFAGLGGFIRLKSPGMIHQTDIVIEVKLTVS